MKSLKKACFNPECTVSEEEIQENHYIYCRKCGYALKSHRDIKKCPSCPWIPQPGDEFCVICGERIKYNV